MRFMASSSLHGTEHDLHVVSGMRWKHRSALEEAISPDVIAHGAASLLMSCWGTLCFEFHDGQHSACWLRCLVQQRRGFDGAAQFQRCGSGAATS